MIYFILASLLLLLLFILLLLLLGQEHIIEYPVNDSTNSTPPARIVVNDLKIIQSSLISVPLMVALIISLLLLVGLTYHVKCGRRGKPKKVAVDDGDYLINGMYL